VYDGSSASPVICIRKQGRWFFKNFVGNQRPVDTYNSFHRKSFISLYSIVGNVLRGDWQLSVDSTKGVISTDKGHLTIPLIVLDKKEIAYAALSAVDIADVDDISFLLGTKNKPANAYGLTNEAGIVLITTSPKKKLNW
jgi:hypothetical protein